MEDHSIIQGQSVLEVMFAFLLTLVTSYVYISCKLYAQRTDAAHLSRMKALHPGGTDDNQQSFSPARSQKWSFSIRDWLAPIIVWAAVSWIGLAVVCILLGEN